MNLALRLFAGAIDFLQFMFLVVLAGFQFITPVGGGVTGAAAGAYLCYNATSGAVSGLLEGLKCAVGGGIVGAGLSAFALPAGIAIDIAISTTFGFLLICFLWASGRFSLMPVIIGFTGEMLPMVNGFVPAWSLLVHRCIHQYNLEQRKGAEHTRTSFGILSTAARLVPFSGGGTAAALIRNVPNAPSNTSPFNTPKERESINRVLLPTKNFDGIRHPANTPHEATA
jgi:hypothetical protein